MNNYIAIDAMGGDNAPVEIIKGAVAGVNSLDVNICIVGDESVIKTELNKHSYNSDKITVRHASQVITGDDTPTEAIKNKKDSSMVSGLYMIKKGEVSAFVSAGNTGALMAGATVIVGRIKGIERPAIATLLPTVKGVSLLLDCGANADIKPHYLQQFALMGSVYMENVVNIKAPSIGLINIGTEETKGSEIYKQGYELLKSSGLNFIGNLEGTDIAQGIADVLVCDGFVGNVVLKHSEGLSMALLGIIKQEITKSLKSKIAASILKPDFKRIKKKFDASEYGGAPLLGLKGLVVKAHGSSDSKAIENAVRQCHLFMENDIVGKISEKL